MKRYFFSLLAIAITIASLAFTNAPENKDRFACTWFIFDDPSITNPLLDYPTTGAIAKDQSKYRLPVGSELTTLCNNTLRICAVCADPDPVDPTKPDFFVPVGGPAPVIVTEIDNYFLSSEPRVPNALLIKEKLQ